MPLVFIHGVNTRNTDKDYYRASAARKKMFETYVVPILQNKGFPDFTVRDDIYWGDLGVTFSWNLRSIPVTNVTDYLGPAEQAQPENLALLNIISATQMVPSAAAPAGVERLGPSDQSLLARAAAHDPGGLVRAIFSVEADRFAPAKPDFRISAERTDAEGIEQHYREGAQLALLLQAVNDFAEAATADSSLIRGETNDEVIASIGEGVQHRYSALLEPGLKDEGGLELEHLGRVNDAISWTWGRAQDALEAARELANSAKETTLRAGSLYLNENYRSAFSSRGLRFFGDVLVFLQRGSTADPSILQRVKQGLDACKPTAAEPFILVTHSFGSEIAYELLTTGALDDLTLDLWVTVGAQTSLFAEMLLYTKSPSNVPTADRPYLGKPANVRSWINIYDAADVLSFLHEPVFGAEAVTDISFREGANLGNAHGAYFLAPSFYETIGKAAATVLNSK
jgi:hypothetical protein